MTTLRQSEPAVEFLLKYFMSQSRRKIIAGSAAAALNFPKFHLLEN
jgi:hypothetical protein